MMSVAGVVSIPGMMTGQIMGRGIHSSTSQLNLSALYGIGGVRRGCVARSKGMAGGV
jgi:hypothetical protein